MAALLHRSVLRAHELFTGRHILDRLEGLLQTQWLDRDALMALQRAKLQRVIDYAYQYVPYYRRTFDAAGFSPDELREDLDALRKLPVLTKAIIRENFSDMMTTEPQRRKKMTKLATSGSTGHPLVFMQDSDFRDCVTADIQRHLSWGGWEMGKVHAYIWGISYTGDWKYRLRDRLIDWAWNRFKMNAFILTDASMTAFAEKIRRRKPRILFGYASSLYRFAQFIRQSDYRDITFDAVFSSAETLLPAVRQFLEETFQCKVFNRHGSLELGGISCECEAHTGMHVSMENNYVEILRDGQPAQPGEIGDVVVTNLNNLGMPFIRYSVGDVASWYEGDSCPCGRAYPMISSVEGRLVESFKTADGRTVWAGFAGSAYRCLTNPQIKQFQVVQKTLDWMVVRLVPAGEIPHEVQDEIVKALQTTFGSNVAVTFEFLSEIPPLPSGKHQYAVSEVP